MKSKNHILLLFACLGLVSCIDQIDIGLGEEPVLIIEGSLTDQPGPHVVNLDFSTGFNKNALFEKTRSEVQGAQVDIVDNQGGRTNLIDQKNGKYQTSQNFKGKSGVAYHVEVVLSNGKRYQSLPETLLPATEIIQGSFEKRDLEVVTETSTGFVKSIFFKLDIQDNPEQNDYYRWRYRGTYQVFAPLGNLPDTCIIACPRGPCWETIADCWATDFDFQFLKVDSDTRFNGELLKEFEIYSIQVDRRFNIGYSALIEQHAISERSHNYWQAVKNQIGNNGTIFETPNFRINGNIRAVEDPDEFVLGYFNVSSVSSVRVFVDRDDVGSTPGEILCGGVCLPPECIDCEQWPATRVKPDFWPN